MILILSMEVGGRTYRIGERSIDVDWSSASRTVHVQGGMATSDYEEEIELFGIGKPMEFSKDVLLPEDMLALHAAGQQIGGEPGELALVEEGDDWEERRILIRGTYSSQQPGRAGEATRVTLSADPGEDGAQWPPETAVLDADGTAGWTPDDPAVDAREPWIIGGPGTVPSASGAQYRAATPAYLVDVVAGANKVLIAGHRCTPRDTIRLIDDTTGSYSDLATWVLTTDGQGREVSIVTFDEAADLGGSWAAGDALAVSWLGAGGALNPYSGGTLTRLGDVLRWALERSSMPVDWSRFAGPARALPWRLDGYWDERCSPWEWARDQIIPLAPISVCYGPDGLFPVLIPSQPRADMAVAHLEDGRGSTLIRGVEVDDSERVQGCRVSYCRDYQGDYRAAVTERGTPPDAGRYGRSVASAIGAQRTTALLEVKADLVWSQATASWIARWQTVVYSRPRVTITMDTRHGSGLHAGDVVLVTAGPFTSHPAVIRSCNRVGPLHRLKLWLPPRLG